MTQPEDSAADLASWNAVAATYAATVTGTDGISARFASFLSEELGHLPGTRVLDLGCGHGWLAARLGADGAKVLGVDGSPELLAIGRSRHPGLELHQTDLTKGSGTGAGPGLRPDRGPDGPHGPSQPGFSPG